MPPISISASELLAQLLQPSSAPALHHWHGDDGHSHTLDHVKAASGFLDLPPLVSSPAPGRSTSSRAAGTSFLSSASSISGDGDHCSAIRWEAPTAKMGPAGPPASRQTTRHSAHTSFGGVAAAAGAAAGEQEDVREERREEADRFELEQVPKEVILRPGGLTPMTPPIPPQPPVPGSGTPPEMPIENDPPYPPGSLPLSTVPEIDGGPPHALADGAHLWARFLSLSTSKAVQEARHLQTIAQAARDVSDNAATQVEYLMYQPCLRKTFREGKGWTD